METYISIFGFCNLSRLHFDALLSRTVMLLGTNMVHANIILMRDNYNNMMVLSVGIVSVSFPSLGTIFSNYKTFSHGNRSKWRIILIIN